MYPTKIKSQPISSGWASALPMAPLSGGCGRDGTYPFSKAAARVRSKSQSSSMIRAQAYASAWLHSHCQARR